MECFLVFIVVFFAGIIHLILSVLSKLKLIDSDSELYITEP